MEKLVCIENEIVILRTIDIHLNKERIFFKVSLFIFLMKHAGQNPIKINTYFKQRVIIDFKKKLFIK